MKTKFIWLMSVMTFLIFASCDKDDDSKDDSSNKNEKVGYLVINKENGVGASILIRYEDYGMERELMYNSSDYKDNDIIKIPTNGKAEVILFKCFLPASEAEYLGDFSKYHYIYFDDPFFISDGERIEVNLTSYKNKICNENQVKFDFDYNEFLKKEGDYLK